MKREILFRGKRKDNWVYGCYNYCGKNNIHEIISEEYDYIGVSVDKETVSQFTGFKDKHGQPIYEADLLHTPGYYCEVKFIDGMFCSVYNHPEDGETLPLADLSPERFEIIGNIYED